MTVGLPSYITGALPNRMLTPHDEADFRVSFNTAARTYRAELWVILMIGMALLLVFDDVFLDAEHQITHKPLLVIVGIALPVLLRWASARSVRLARWSTPLYVVSVVLDIVVLLAVRIQTTDDDHETIPLLAVIAVLLSLLLVQIRFEILAPLLIVGYAGVAIAELIVFPLTPSNQVELFASAAVTFIPLGTVYAHERTLRRTWLVERELGVAARTDSLTGLPNRRAAEEHLAALPPNAAVSVAIFDVDDFKHYNDDFGHPAGDRCLAMIGASLRADTLDHHTEFAARLSGEEFIVVWHDRDGADVVERAETLRTRVGDIAPVPPADRTVTMSAGLCTLSDPSRLRSDVEFQSLIDRADKALYAAKESGKNRLVVGPQIDAEDLSLHGQKVAQSSVYPADAADEIVTTASQLRFRDSGDEDGFSRSHNDRILPVRRLVMGGFAAVIATMFSVQSLSVMTSADSIELSRVVLGGLMFPASLLGVAGTVVNRLRPYSTHLYIAACGVILIAQMIQRSIQLPQGIDMVPILWPLAVILSMSVAQIPFSKLLPASVLYLAAIIAIDVTVLPVTTSRSITYATSILMVATTIRLAYRVEFSARLGWMSARRLKQLSNTDTLTGLPNRRAFDATVASWRRSGEPHALVLIDVDRFKAFNDEFGHLAGDDRLREVGERLAAYATRDVVVARVGGEEFAVLVRRCDRTDLCSAVEAARRKLSTVRPDASLPAALTLSAGLAFSTDRDDLVSRADSQLYRAKAEGRDRLAVEHAVQPSVHSV
ncbi:GGDEF domain-containing protein [Gordonia malaquae]|uniref:GGDEF domain-containing protein n=1 Tax=Gordonia malaquae TaxID=410332 RepID=UPI0030FE1B84